MGPEGGAGYSSPHLMTIDGVRQVLLMRGARTTSVSPADGRMLWQNSMGAERQHPAAGADVEWRHPARRRRRDGRNRHPPDCRQARSRRVDDRRTVDVAQPEALLQRLRGAQEYAFGFDGGILACIDLADGSRQWKGGRYGHGQMVLLPEQGLLLVIEEGEPLVQRIPRSVHGRHLW